MKILIVCHDNRPFGAMASLIEWASSLNRNDVMFVYPKKSGDEFLSWLDKNNFIFYKVKYRFCVGNVEKKRILSKIEWLIKKILWKFYSFYSLRKVYYKVKDKQFDCVLSNTSSIDFGVRIARKLGIPHVWHIREFLEEDHKLTPFNKEEFGSFCSESYAIFISKCLKDSWTKKYSFLGNTVIYNYVSNSSIYAHKQNSESLNILIAGRIQENKGQMIAVQAVEYAVNKFDCKCNLYIYGEGPDYKRIENYVINNDLKYIHLCGFTKHLNKIREDMDICLVCSSNEAFGRVTIEAMYSRNLVIASNTGANLEIIRDMENGIFYKNNDYIDLAEKIVSVYKMDKMNRAKILDVAENDANNNYSKNTMPKIVAYINQVLEEV